MSKKIFAAALLGAFGLSAKLAHADIGQHTAQRLQDNYDNIVTDCGGSAVPAHACSGVLLRSTRPSPDYHTWDHSQNSKAKGGVSFSYLRADIPTSSLAEDARSGLILFPLMHRPGLSLRYQVLCAWPTDGDSWERNEQGCGDNAQTAQAEMACHKHGILTAADWIENYRGNNDYKRQCAFDVRDQRIPERADAFYQAIVTQRDYAAELPFPWNEVIVAAWDEAESHRLPIKAFFYIDGKYNALQQAQEDQSDWQRTNGSVIPIIRLNLASAATARFSYHPEEQAVGAD
ncbi:hypothetical protein [Pseudomonas shirazensis]|uniref:hypothetical protein n=1 Tax=Pseudomonas shirazensis TaxID=2745494 RepID=UPI003D2BE1F1